MTSPALRTTSRYSDNAFPSLHTGVPSVYFFSIFSSCSSSPQHCKLQPSQTNASVLDTAGTLFFCAFLYARPLLLASSPYSPAFSWLTSTYSSGFSLLQKAFSVPTKLGQVALYMLLEHFVPGSLMILHCIVY